MKNVDKKFRPSDQRGTLRNYSRMDNDLWDRMELRGWFDKYYDPQPLALVEINETGYLKPTIRLNPPNQVAMRQSTSDTLMTAARDTFGSPSGPSVPMSLSAPLREGPHWMDHEAHVKVQRQESLELARTVPPLRRPWKDRPIEEEREGFDPVISAEQIKQQQDSGLFNASKLAGESRAVVHSRAIAQKKGSGIFA